MDKMKEKVHVCPMCKGSGVPLYPRGPFETCNYCDEGRVDGKELEDIRYLQTLGRVFGGILLVFFLGALFLLFYHFFG